MKQQKPQRTVKLNSISPKYVEDRELRDAPARLFRALLNKLEMTPHKWTTKLRNYLDYVVTTKDPEKSKTERITRTGNIKDTYFQKPTLTFNKLLEGLSILEIEECEIILRTKDSEGNVIEVQEKIRILTKDRLTASATRDLSD